MQKQYDMVNETNSSRNTGDDPEGRKMLTIYKLYAACKVKFQFIELLKTWCHCEERLRRDVAISRKKLLSMGDCHNHLSGLVSQ